jgi:hypothetical protein
MTDEPQQERPSDRLEEKARSDFEYDVVHTKRDGRLGGLVYNEIIETEADLNECSEDSEKWKGELNSEKESRYFKTDTRKVQT